MLLLLLRPRLARAVQRAMSCPVHRAIAPRQILLVHGRCGDCACWNLAFCDWTSGSYALSAASAGSIRARRRVCRPLPCRLRVRCRDMRCRQQQRLLILGRSSPKDHLVHWPDLQNRILVEGS